MSDTMTAEQYNELMAKQKGASKYGNIRCRIDGHTFDSLMEGARYRDLKLMLRQGAIKFLQVHERFPLRGESGEEITYYEADFTYYEEGRDGVWRQVSEDVKGKRTDMFNLKAKWMKLDHGTDIRLITADMIDTTGMAEYAI